MIELGIPLQGKMLRVEPDGVVVSTANDTEEVWIQPDLRFPFIAGKEVILWVLFRDGILWRGSLQKPLIQLLEVEFLTVVAVSDIGIFLDWGFTKDLFCPFAQSIGTFQKGQIIPVRLIKDTRSQRLMATMKWKKGTRPADDLEKGMEVSVMVMEPSEIGYAALIDNQYLGMIYENQIFEELRLGQKLSAFVNKVRDDGKVDLLLQKPGVAAIGDAEEEVMAHLKDHKGKLDLGDKSPAEDIYQQLNMSKKVFKKAIGGLYRKGLIGMEDLKIWKLVVGDD